MTGFPDQSTIIRQNDELRKQVAELTEEICQLRELLVPTQTISPLMATFGLTLTESKIIHHLLTFDLVPTTRLLSLMELTKKSRSNNAISSLRVVLCKADEKVRERIGGGKVVRVIYGEGYWIGEGDKGRIRAAMEGKDGACNGQQAGEGGRADRQYRQEKKPLATGNHGHLSS